MPAAFAFHVGELERYEITVRIAGFRNRVTIEANGALMIDSGGNMGIVMPNVFDFEVGVNEKHMVSVRFIAQQLVDGGASYIDVFIDGRFAFRHPW
ncbi:hypothetical protein JD276_11135 [Leucobacter sp. CSA1]|uniref:Uncharacterized protein n=1 Tax=Leucobacter chromiisoli TaxID=2796471 RepID=A0A934QAG6_9MICO|nr:hypothetical protein [Leucobacter chromiisoli]MBK0419589.1 hypothetical protein [Leucobacter chromiisoli]